MSPFPTTESSATTPLGTACYLTFIAIFSFLKAFGFYEGQTIFTLGLLIGCVLMIVKITLTRHSISEHVIIILLMGMGLLVYRNTGEKSLLINLMVIVGLKGVSPRKSIQTFLASWGIGYILLSALSLLGLHSDALYIQYKNGIGDILRHALGQTHQNVLHTAYLSICCAILYLAASHYSRRQRLALVGLLMAGNLYVFSYSISYTGLLSCTVLYLFYLYVTFRPQLNLFERTLAQLILPLCLVFSLIGPLVIQGRLFELMDRILSSRYYLTRYFLTNETITLFGTRITFLPSYSIDCSYTYLFIQLGVIPFAIIVALYMGTLHSSLKKGRKEEAAILLAMFVGGIMEPFLFNMSFKNMTLILVGEYLYEMTDKLFTGNMRSPVPSRILDTASRAENRFAGLVSFLSLWPTAVCTLCSHTLREWMRHWLRYLAIAAAAALISGGIVWLLRSPVQSVYVSSSATNFSNEDTIAGELVFLDEDDVTSIRSRGDIVYDYVDETQGMYLYTGLIANLEYARILLSVSVWCAVLACFAGAGITLRKRLRLTESDIE